MKSPLKNQKEQKKRNQWTEKKNFSRTMASNLAYEIKPKMGASAAFLCF